MVETSFSSSDRGERFVKSVSQFAESVLKRCHDSYGANETPLLADGIDLKTGEPARWEGNVTSNLACQQNLLRTLHGLAILTGEADYQKKAYERLYPY